MSTLDLPLRSVLVIAIVAGLGARPTIADTPSSATNATSIAATSDHPLAWTFNYASARSEYIRKHVQDYSCRLIKRERINGVLQARQFINVQVRCEQKRDGEVVQPMSVFMQYLSPKIVRDRRILYVKDQNDGKILVRKGGSSMNYLRLQFDPNSRAVQRSSNYRITDVGFDKIIDRLLEHVVDDIKNDPSAINTEVSHFRNARVGERVCTHIRVVHPKPAAGLRFHQASLYVDDELHVPIRLIVYDWPATEGDDPPLQEEYVYVDLKLNVGLSDAHFNESRLDSPNGRPVLGSAQAAN